MEFKEVVGTRRSTRIWQPWRPVEEEKLQTILEAINRAPRLLEVDFVRAVYMRRDSLTHEQIEQLKTPTTTSQIELCPVVLWVYADLDALERATDGRALEALIDAGALNESHGWTRERVRSTVVPQVYQAVLDDPDRVPLMVRTPEGMREAASYPRALMALARHAIGVAQAHALLAAVDLGLGVQLSAIAPAVPKQIMGIPDSWIASSPMLLGYSAEQPGGQRPREPLEEDVFEGRYGRPFESDPVVVSQLKSARMIQDPVPTAWRRAELRRLARMFGLPE
jgi:nitroreductase